MCIYIINLYLYMYIWLKNTEFISKYKYFSSFQKLYQCETKLQYKQKLR